MRQSFAGMLYRNKSRKKGIAAIGIVFTVIAFGVIFAACSPNISIAVEEEDTVAFKLDEAINAQRLQSFMDNMSNEKPDKVMVVTYTKEGDPLYYELQYDGKKTTLVYNNGEDRYGGADKGKRSYEINSIEKNGNTYIVSAKDSDATFSFTGIEIHQPGTYQDTGAVSEGGKSTEDIQKNESDEAYPDKEAFLNSPDGHAFQVAAWKFTKAYLNGDVRIMKDFLINPENKKNHYYTENKFDDVEFLILKLDPKDIKKDSVIAEYEFLLKGEDSAAYVYLEMKKMKDEWKIENYGLEK